MNQQDDPESDGLHTLEPQIKQEQVNGEQINSLDALIVGVEAQIAQKERTGSLKHSFLCSQLEKIISAFGNNVEPNQTLSIIQSDYLMVKKSVFEQLFSSAISAVNPTLKQKLRTPTTAIVETTETETPETITPTSLPNVIINNYFDPKMLITELQNQQKPSLLSPQQIIKLMSTIYPTNVDKITLLTAITSIVTLCPEPDDSKYISVGSFSDMIILDEKARLFYRSLFTAAVEACFLHFPEPTTIINLIFPNYQDPTSLRSSLLSIHKDKQAQIEKLLALIYNKEIQGTLVETNLVKTTPNSTFPPISTQTIIITEMHQQLFTLSCHISKLICAAGYQSIFFPSDQLLLRAHFKQRFKPEFDDDLVQCVYRPMVTDLSGRGPRQAYDSQTHISTPLLTQNDQLLTPPFAFTFFGIYTLLQIFCVNQFNILIPNLVENGQSPLSSLGGFVCQKGGTIQQISSYGFKHLKGLILQGYPLNVNGVFTAKFIHQHPNIFATVNQFQMWLTSVEIVEFSKALSFSTLLVGPAGNSKSELANLLAQYLIIFQIPIHFVASNNVGTTFTLISHQPTTSNPLEIKKTIYQTNTSNSKHFNENIQSFVAFSTSVINSTLPTIVFFDPPESNDLSCANFELVAPELVKQFGSETIFLLSTHSQPSHPKKETTKGSDGRDISPPTYYWHLHFYSPAFRPFLIPLFEKVIANRLGLLDSDTSNTMSYQQQRLELDRCKKMLKFTESFCNVSIRSYLFFLQSNPEVFLAALMHYTLEPTSIDLEEISRTNVVKSVIKRQVTTNVGTSLLERVQNRTITDLHHFFKNYIMSSISHYSSPNSESTSLYIEDILTPSHPVLQRQGNATEDMYYFLLNSGSPVTLPVGLNDGSTKPFTLHHLFTLGAVTINQDKKTMIPLLKSPTPVSKVSNVVITHHHQIAEQITSIISPLVKTWPISRAVVFRCPINYPLIDDITLVFNDNNTFTVYCTQISISDITTHDPDSFNYTALLNDLTLAFNQARSKFSFKSGAAVFYHPSPSTFSTPTSFSSVFNVNRGVTIITFSSWEKLFLRSAYTYQELIRHRFLTEIASSTLEDIVNVYRLNTISAVKISDGTCDLKSTDVPITFTDLPIFVQGAIFYRINRFKSANPSIHAIQVFELKDDSTQTRIHVSNRTYSQSNGNWEDDVWDIKSILAICN